MYEIIPDEKKLLKNPWQDPRLPSRCQVACAELELDCCCYYPAQPAGRGPRLPSRREVACVELELDCCCHYPAGRGPRLPSAARWRARSWSWTAAATVTTMLDDVRAWPLRIEEATEMSERKTAFAWALRLLLVSLSAFWALTLALLRNSDIRIFSDRQKFLPFGVYAFAFWNPKFLRSQPLACVRFTARAHHAVAGHPE